MSMNYYPEVGIGVDVTDFKSDMFNLEKIGRCFKNTHIFLLQEEMSSIIQKKVNLDKEDYIKLGQVVVDNIDFYDILFEVLNITTHLGLTVDIDDNLYIMHYDKPIYYYTKEEKNMDKEEYYKYIFSPLKRFFNNFEEDILSKVEELATVSYS